MRTLCNRNPRFCDMRRRAGVSMLEYALLVIIILSVFMVMQFYISRAFNGRWKGVGDSFGMGRQYQAGKSIDCTYAQVDAGTGVWFDSDCYQQAMNGLCLPGNTVCEDQQKLVCAQPYCQPDQQ